MEMTLTSHIVENFNIQKFKVYDAAIQILSLELSFPLGLQMTARDFVLRFQKMFNSARCIYRKNQKNLSVYKFSTKPTFLYKFYCS